MDISRNSFHHLVLLLCLVTLAAGCGGPSTQPSATSQDVVPTVQVVSSGNPPEKRVISTEIIPQNNCGGSAAASSTIERSRSIVYELEVGGEVSVHADGTVGVPGFGEVQVGTKVAMQYGVTYGQEETVSRSLTVSAKEGTSMQHTLQQVEYWETGELLFTTAGEEPRRYPYSFRRDFGIELVQSEDAGCDASTVLDSTPTPMPSSTPDMPTVTPAPPTATHSQATSTLAPPDVSPTPAIQPQPTTTESRGNPPVPAPLGWAFEQDGVQLNLVRAEIRAESYGESAAARLWFSLLNKTSQKLLIELDRDQIYIQDSENVRYVDWDGSGVQSFWLEPGGSKIIDRYYTSVPKKRSRISASALPVVVHVTELSRVQEAQWVIGGPPLPTYSDGDPAGSLGSRFDLEEFSVALTDLEIRTSQGGESAAFRAWFSVKNTSGQSKLLEMDYAYIYVEDSFGTRYIDWDAVGVYSRWLDSGQEFVFDRYYTTEYHIRSRIPIGAAYVVVVSEGIGRGQRIQWRVDIAR